MAKAILIDIPHEGSYKPAPTKSKLGPTTPALVAACMRMKKSGRRRTPKAAMNVMMDPKSTKNADSHINISILSALCGSSLNEDSKGDSGKKTDQGNAEDYIDRKSTRLN